MPGNVLDIEDTSVKKICLQVPILVGGVGVA